MAAIWTRLNTLLLLVMLFALLAVIGLLATDIQGGSLDPPEPPDSTMKSLDEIPGSWSRRLDSTNGASGPLPPAGCDSDRFRCVLSYVECVDALCANVYGAVLDEETGLVWERSPAPATGSWGTAVYNCGERAVGNRRGWRLPTREEALTILDPTNGNLLPVGSPFENIGQDNTFWTETTYFDTPQTAWVLITGIGDAAFLKGDQFRYWCVRGHGGFDGR